MNVQRRSSKSKCARARSRNAVNEADSDVALARQVLAALQHRHGAVWFVDQVGLFEHDTFRGLRYQSPTYGRAGIPERDLHRLIMLFDGDRCADQSVIRLSRARIEAITECLFDLAPTTPQRRAVA
jgi:hypothetical protein